MTSGTVNYINQCTSICAFLFSLLFCIRIFGLNAPGDKFIVDNWRYVITSQNTVSLIETQRYGKKIEIPSQFLYNNQNYFVTGLNAFDISADTLIISENINNIQVQNGFYSSNEIQISPFNEFFTLSNGGIYSKDLKKLILYRPIHKDINGNHNFIEDVDEITLDEKTIEVTCNSLAGLRFNNNRITFNHPMSLRVIGKGAFNYVQLSNNAKTIIDIPEGVETIEEFALDKIGKYPSIDTDEAAWEKYWGNNWYVDSDINSTSSVDINLPASLSNLSNLAFSKCQIIDKINISSNNPFYFVHDNIVYDRRDNSIGAMIPAKEITVANFVDFVTYNDILPDATLETISFANPNTFIGAKTFYQSAVKKINLPQNIAFLEDSVFAYTKFKTIELPSSVRKIESGILCGNRNINEITLYATTPPDCEFDSFDTSIQLFVTLYVPEESIDLYKQSPGWSSFSRIRPIPESCVNPLPDSQSPESLYDLNGSHVDLRYSGIVIKKNQNKVSKTILFNK